MKKWSGFNLTKLTGGTGPVLSYACLFALQVAITFHAYNTYIADFAAHTCYTLRMYLPALLLAVLVTE